jgi:hypothetical protein
MYSTRAGVALRLSGAGALDLGNAFCCDGGVWRAFRLDVLLHDKFSFPAPERSSWAWLGEEGTGLRGACLPPETPLCKEGRAGG